MLSCVGKRILYKHRSMISRNLTNPCSHVHMLRFWDEANACCAVELAHLDKTKDNSENASGEKNLGKIWFPQD